MTSTSTSSRRRWRRSLASDGDELGGRARAGLVAGHRHHARDPRLRRGGDTRGRRRLHPTGRAHRGRAHRRLRQRGTLWTEKPMPVQVDFIVGLRPPHPRWQELLAFRAAVAIALVLLFLTGLIADLPKAVLGAVIIAASWSARRDRGDRRRGRGVVL